MSQTTKLILLISVVVFVLLTIVAWIILWSKIKKINQKNPVNQNLTPGLKDILNRKNVGELLWDLKLETNYCLDDFRLEYLINTTIRNQFSNILIIGKNPSYEIFNLVTKTNANFTTLLNSIPDLKWFQAKRKQYQIDNSRINLLQQKQFKIKFDLIIFKPEIAKLESNFNNFWSYLKSNGLFIICNDKQNKLAKKSLINYLKQQRIRFELENISQGLILIVK